MDELHDGKEYLCEVRERSWRVCVYHVNDEHFGACFKAGLNWWNRSEVVRFIPLPLATRAAELQHWLRELLAVIHCDGGHTTEGIGIEKAVNKAIDVRNQQIIRMEELQAENERLRTMIQNIYNDIPGPACDAMHDHGVFDDWIAYKKEGEG